MLLCLHVSNRTFFLLLKICYICLLISPIPSVRPLMFNAFGIAFYVTVSPPKTINSLIRRYKTYYKDNPQIDPYKMAYCIIPSQAASSPYAKISTLTAISAMQRSFPSLPMNLVLSGTLLFGDDNYKQVPPEMLVKKKSNSPDEDKSIDDSAFLKPVWEIPSLIPLISIDPLKQTPFSKGLDSL